MTTSAEDQRRASRRGFLTWGAVMGGLLATAVWPLRKIGLGAVTHPSHGAEPHELPEFYYGPRIGEPGYEERVAKLFEGRDLPGHPTSY